MIHRHATLFRGTTVADDRGWTLASAAKAEAYSRWCSRNSQTTINPSNGYWLSFSEDADPKLVESYRQQVEKLLAKEGNNG